MDNDGLTNDQTEKVLHFQDVTGIEDINVCRDVLVRHQWDLEVAIQEQLNMREGRPSMYATEQRPPQVVNDRYLQHVFSSNRRGVPPSGFTGIFGYVFNYVFNICYSTFQSVLAAVFSFFKGPERITDPLGDVLSFIQTYNEKYPAHPVFYQGTYAQALNDAKRELKFLLVYLHSETSSEAVRFSRTILSDQSVIDYVNRRNMLFWACDVAASEGNRVAQTMNARIYPLMLIIGMRANKMIIMGRMEGECSAEELLGRLQTVVGDNEVWLNQARAERLERSFTQSLRQEQDEAYEQSLRADQEKERKKQLERDEEQKKLQEIENARLAELQRKENIAKLKIELAEQVPSEPAMNSPNSVSVVFKLPNGARLERRFLYTHSLQDVYNFVFCHPLSPDEFEITTNFPKRVLCDSKTNEKFLTLLEAGLRNREVLFIYDLDA